MNLSPKIIKKQEFKHFFGLDGALPICFSELLTQKQSDFFEFVFAAQIAQQYKNFMQSQEEEIHYFYQLFQHAKKNICTIKILRFNNQNNKLNQGKLNHFILGTHIYILDQFNNNHNQLNHMKI